MHFLDTHEIETFFLRSQKLETLYPGSEVNNFFHDLCSFCVRNEKKVPHTKEVEALQNICSTGECLLEKLISQRVINGENPWETLRGFEYYNNYEDLSRLEYLNLTFYGQVKSILFLGAGALPLTAIILAKNYNIRSTIVDYDQEAYSKGKQLIEKLGLENLVEYVHGDAYTYHDSRKYDICYVAALVWGEKEQQIDLLNNIHSNIDAKYFLLRSSHGTRELLYKKVSLSLVREFLKLEHIVHPKNHIINSIIITKKYE